MRHSISQTYKQQQHNYTYTHSPNHNLLSIISIINSLANSPSHQFWLRFSFKKKNSKNKRETPFTPLNYLTLSPHQHNAHHHQTWIQNIPGAKNSPTILLLRIRKNSQTRQPYSRSHSFIIQLNRICFCFSFFNQIGKRRIDFISINHSNSLVNKAIDCLISIHNGIFGFFFLWFRVCVFLL